MDTISIVEQSALSIAGDVRAGRIRAVDVVRAHLDRIDELDPGLNAFQVVRRSEVVAEAGELDADPRRAALPLAGVPVAVKDNIAVRGVSTSFGSAATSDEPASTDDELIRRLRAAGCIVLGTTRMPELAAWAFTSSVYGPTRNPWDPTLDPGGSTGGGAVAVRTGMAALAVGTDGGGSIRIPAAQCGLVGLKPTAGFVPLPGGLERHWFGLSVSGPLARTSADAAAALEVLSGMSMDVTVPRGLRVAISLKSPSPLGRADAHQHHAVEAAAELLRAAGHTVVEADPPYPPTLLQRWSRRWWAGLAEDADRLAVRPAALEPRTRTMVAKGRRVMRFGGPRASGSDAWAQRVARWFAESSLDAVVMPTVAVTRLTAGAMDSKGYLPTFLMGARQHPFCQAWNLAGTPSVAVPVGFADGLPLSVQIAGLAGSDGTLLGIAGQLERPQLWTSGRVS